MKSNKVKVAIQGTNGAFHELAAREFFLGREVDIVPCERFEDEFSCLREGSADYAAIAVENSVAGSLLANLSLIHDNGMPVFGEHYIRIVQNLMALPGQSVNDISEVRSHPVALQQCRDFLESFRIRGVRIVDDLDTAMSAESISKNRLYGVAAIAGSFAADIYGLEILKRGIESNRHNYTRFLFITSRERAADFEGLKDGRPDKSSLCFTLPHKPGKLSQILTTVSRQGLNLTKIQSLPLPGKEWEYLFYLDVTFSDYCVYSNVLDELRSVCDELGVLGEYRQGVSPSY